MAHHNCGPMDVNISRSAFGLLLVRAEFKHEDEIMLFQRDFRRSPD